MNDAEHQQFLVNWRFFYVGEGSQNRATSFEMETKHKTLFLLQFFFDTILEVGKIAK